MRLRRETGDFRIKVTEDDGTITVNSINKNLLGEDLLGQVVEVGGDLEVVTKVSENKLAGTVTAVCGTYTLTYTKGTGAITAVENE
jgi:hypothetical protein